MKKQGKGEKEKEAAAAAKFRFIWDYDHGVLDVNCMTKRMFAVETFTREQIERCSNHVKNCNNSLMIITFTSSCVCVCVRASESLNLVHSYAKWNERSTRAKQIVVERRNVWRKSIHTHTHKLNENEPNNNGTEEKNDSNETKERARTRYERNS